MKTFEDWITLKLAEKGFQGFDLDEIKEILDKAVESKNKHKIEPVMYNKEQMKLAFEYGETKEPFDSFYDFLQSLK